MTPNDLAVVHIQSDTHPRANNGNPLAPSQDRNDTHRTGVGSNPLAVIHTQSDIQHTHNNGNNFPLPNQSGADTQARTIGEWEPFSFDDIRMYSETLDDIEDVRMALENRIRALEDECTGAAALPTDIYVMLLGDVAAEKLLSVGGMRVVGEDGERKKNPAYDSITKDAKGGIWGNENYVIKQLERAMENHPLGPWIMSPAQKGLGLKQAGRLLGVIEDPYIRAPVYGEDGEVLEPARPRRGPGELWAYCGAHTVPGEHGGNVAPRHQKGVQSNWNDKARMRLYTIAMSCMKQRKGNPLRDVYDRGRKKYANAVHENECRNRSRINPNGCGTREHPEWGEVGSPWRLGHQHAAALRLVYKEVLKGLYNEAKRLHQTSPPTTARPIPIVLPSEG